VGIVRKDKAVTVDNLTSNELEQFGAAMYRGRLKPEFYKSAPYQKLLQICELLMFTNATDQIIINIQKEETP